MVFSLCLSLGFLVGFGISSKTDKFRLYNGLLLMAAFASLAVACLPLLAESAFFSVLVFTMLTAMTVCLFLTPILLISNGVTMAKREGINLSHSLSLLMGLGCLVLLGGMVYITFFSPSWWIKDAYTFLLLIAGYLAVMLLGFLIDTLLYSRISRRNTYDFILVLGAGLLDGHRVSPLLAGRLDKALNIYQRNPQATIIVSGGQGSDEWIPEAEAMAGYLIDKGVSPSQILQERRSTTTLENMTFSKEMMEQQKSDYRCTFVTNNYHVFRAGMYARQIHLKADGAGSKTAGYYLPSALLREFAAIMWQRRYAFGVYALLALSFVLR